MSSTATAFEMAESLLVLTGDNAWNAARAFGADYAKIGKPDEARHWRDVARAVLRKLSGATAEPAILDAKPVIEPDAFAPSSSGSLVPFTIPVAATAPALRVAPGTPLAAPIPMRAKRQMAVLAARPVQAQAELDFAKAA